jgi:TPP-dependent 2-oxoacid decarboxylase
VRVGQYLFQRLREEGVTHTFGIPGDFALSLYSAQEESGMPTLVMTHEPSVGYAADVYGRLNGLGVALVTYGVGALNMVNATAMAYAEQSPLLVIAGAPETQWQDRDVLFYHRVKSADTQLKVYQEVTAAQASIREPANAAAEIDGVIGMVRRLSRPGFIEIARDVVNLAIPAPPTIQTLPKLEAHNSQHGLREALSEIVHRLNESKRPVIYAGVEIERFGLTQELIELAERTRIPVATSLMGKAVLPERHPSFIGTYFGRMGPERVRRYVEQSDCLIALGMLMTLMDTGISSDAIDRRSLVQITSYGTTISHHHYSDAPLSDILRGLLRHGDLKRHKPVNLAAPSSRKSVEGTRLTMGGIIKDLNQFLTSQHIVLADTGDCLFASVELRAEHFIGPGYYASMGLAVPGAIGAQIARPDLRPIVLVGDGAFHMDGVEIATARDYNLNPIVVVINNQSFATLKVTMGDRSYFRVRPWDYVSFAKSLGGQGVSARTREEFRNALRLAESSGGFFVIDAVIHGADMSATLEKLGAEIRSKAVAEQPKRPGLGPKRRARR